MLVPSRAVLFDSLQYADAAGCGTSDAAHMFDTVTERSTVSLDMQVTAVERTKEVELFGMLDMHLRRLLDTGELQRSMQCLARMVPLEVNPYRPPRGSHLRLQLDHMRSVEWADLTRSQLTVWGTGPASVTTAPQRLSRPSTAELRRPPSGLLHRGDAAARSSLAMQSDSTGDFAVVGRRIACPGGPVMREAALGGFEEETIAAQYDSPADEEEIFAVDWGDEEIGPSPSQAACRNVGLPPVEPIACLLEEVTSIVFKRLWDEQVVPFVVASLKHIAPSQRAQRKKDKEKERKGDRTRHFARDEFQDSTARTSGSFINAFVLEQQQALASLHPPQRISTPLAGEKSPALPQLARHGVVPHRAEANPPVPTIATPPERGLASPSGPPKPVRAVIANASRRGDAKKSTVAEDPRRSSSNSRRHLDESATPEPSGKSNRRSVRKPLVVDDDLVVVGLSNVRDPGAGHLPRLVDAKAQLARAQTANPRNHGALMPNKRVQNS